MTIRPGLAGKQTEDLLSRLVNGINGDSKDAVNVVTTVAMPSYAFSENIYTASANGALTSTYTDGVTPVVGMSILLTNEADAKYNGIVEILDLGSASTPAIWQRRSDANTSEQVTSGMTVDIIQGTYSGSQWMLTTADPIVLNTTSLTFTNNSYYLPKENPTATGTLTAPIFKISTALSNDDALTQLLVRGADGTIKYRSSSSISSSGVFGIANTSGVYTYYSTLHDAMTAASAGNTIEQFADWTYSGTTMITWKNVNFDSHGHKITVSSASNFYFLQFNTTYSCNVNISIDNGSNYGAITIVNPCAGYINFAGSTINTTVAGGSACAVACQSVSTTLDVYNLFCQATVTGALSTIYTSASATVTFYNAVAKAAGSTVGISAGNSVWYNPIGISNSGYGIVSGAACFLYNPTSISVSNVALVCSSGATISGGSSRSTSSSAINLTASTMSNHCAYSVSGAAGQIINSVVDGLYGKGTGGLYLATTASKLTRFTLEATGGYAIIEQIAGNIYDNGNAESTWNNAGGYAMQTLGSSVISRVKFKVAHASANNIYATGAVNNKLLKNIYSGGAGVHANVTNTMVNTEDTYGNITE